MQDAYTEKINCIKGNKGMNMKAEEIRRKIQSLIEERGMNQVDLAKDMGITPSALSRKLSGKIKLSLEDVIKIANLLSVPVSKFADEDIPDTKESPLLPDNIPSCDLYALAPSLSKKKEEEELLANAAEKLKKDIDNLINDHKLPIERREEIIKISSQLIKALSIVTNSWSKA